MRVLVTTPDLTLPGGVANYFGVLRPYLEGVADYHTVGLRSGEDSKTRIGLRMLSDYARFAAKLVRGHYDLVHINPSLGGKALPRDAVFLLLAKALRRPVLVFMRGWDPHCEQAVSARWNRLFRLVYCRADAFIVLAAQFAGKLREFGYAGRIERETTVVPADAFSAPVVRPDAGARPFRILFLSRLEKDKGLYEAIEAYRIVRQQHESAELVVAGSGPESEAVSSYVRERAIPDVRFVGHLTGNSRTEAFASSHLYLFASYHEGMPNSVLEAMAHGLPVVTSAVGGIADFFEDGRMGFSTRTVEPTILAELIERLIADPGLAARMGQNNRSHAERCFAAPKVAQRLVAIYSRVIDDTLQSRN